MRAPMGAGEDGPPASAGETARHEAAERNEPLTFGSQLRRLRIRAGFSQETLAERAGVSVATISALEEGRRHRPFPSTLAALADALELTPSDRTAMLELATESSVETGTVPPQPTLQRGGGTGRFGSLSRLPVPPTALIDRESEVAAAAAMLDPIHSAVRLLTLTGPGGVGKTRVALAVAATCANSFRDGAAFVDLAPVRDTRLVAAAIAQVLHIRESGRSSARELLRSQLRDQQLLLVLDNFEHLLGASPLLAELLDVCPQVALLVTSRTALRLRSEQRFAIVPLAAPVGDSNSTEAIAASAAVRLFVERAQAIAPDFALEAANAPAVAAICRRLDGMPLAIELAAARAGLLQPPALLRRLERSLALLTGGSPDLPQRQQTLRQTLAWSYDLLGPVEQALFRRLAVFAGGWTLDAAEAVSGGADVATDDVVERLAVLYRSSLVQRTGETDAEPRFGLLETVHEYAHELLIDSVDAGDAMSRHAGFYLALAEQSVPELHGPEQAEWLVRLEAERDNLRAALDWLSTQPDLEGALRLASAATWFWLRRGYFTDAQRLLPLLGSTQGERNPQRAVALLAAARLASTRVDYGAQARWNEESLQIFRELGDQAGVAEAVTDLGAALWQQGRLQEAETYLAEGLHLFRVLQDSVGIATALLPLACVARDRGDFEPARAWFAEALALRRATGDQLGEGHVLNNTGWLELYAGDLAAARRLAENSLAIRLALGTKREAGVSQTLLGKVALAAGEFAGAGALFEESLVIHRGVGNPWGVAMALEGVAGLAASTRPNEALQLAGAAAALRAAFGRPMPPAEQPLLARWLDPARHALADELAAKAWADGEALTEAGAVATALELIAALATSPTPR